MDATPSLDTGLTPRESGSVATCVLAAENHVRCPYGEHINLTVDQAEKIAAGLLAAAKKART